MSPEKKKGHLIEMHKAQISGFSVYIFNKLTVNSRCFAELESTCATSLGYKQVHFQ